MRKLLVVLPGIFEEEFLENIGKKSLEVFDHFYSNSEVFRLNKELKNHTNELAYFGLNPEQYKVQKGPLACAAIGVTPPQRDVRFCLSLLSINDDGVIQDPVYIPGEKDLDLLLKSAEVLNTNALTMVKGRKLDHGLIWEKGSIDLHTYSKEEILNQPYDGHQPEGEGDRILTGLIEDSIEILSNHDINKKRQDEGLRPLNILWPWGQGLGISLPNLAMQSGQIAQVYSDSWMIKGISNLVSYQHIDLNNFGAGLNIAWKKLEHSISDGSTSILIFDRVSQLLNLKRPDYAERLFQELNQELFNKIRNLQDNIPYELMLIMTGDSGIALKEKSYIPITNNLPFSTELSQDSMIPKLNIWELTNTFLG